MNPHEVATDLDDKSIKILRLLLREERHLNPGIPATLLTPTVKKEYGWTNQTVLRRFRTLRDASLVRFSDVDSDWPEHDRYPRPPKAIERRIEASELRDVLDHWDGRGTRSPAQLTDDLDNLDHRIDATDDRLTNRIEVVESKLQQAIRTQALAERGRTRFQRVAKLAGYLMLVAFMAYLTVLIWVVFSAPNQLASVLIGGISAILGATFGTGAMIYTQRVIEQT